MRTIFLSTIIVIIGCAASITNSGKPEAKITLYVFNDETDRPGQTLKEEFWGTPGGLDTLEVHGSRLINYYLKKFNTLKPDSITYNPSSFGVYDDFYHSFAFVFIDEKGINDTLYADRILRYFKWEGKQKYYEDTTGFFRKHFGSFLIN
jgi:hypothetical protein